MDNFGRIPVAGGPCLTIPDVTGIPLDVLLGSRASTPLTNAMRRLIQEWLRPQESYSAHSSTP